MRQAEPGRPSRKRTVVRRPRAASPDGAEGVHNPCPQSTSQNSRWGGFCYSAAVGHLLGYARVSTGDQSPDLQLDALRAAGCYRVFVDTAERRPGRPAGADQGARPAPPRRHPGGLEARPPGALPAPPARRRRRPGAPGGRLQEPARERRHHHARRPAGLPPLRRAGRVRARPAPRAHRRRPGRRPRPGPEGRTAAGHDAQKLAVARQLYDARQHTVAAIARTLGVSRASVYRHLRPARPA